jgi:hypothetical protein
MSVFIAPTYKQINSRCKDQRFGAVQQNDNWIGLMQNECASHARLWDSSDIYCRTNTFCTVAYLQDTFIIVSNSIAFLPFIAQHFSHCLMLCHLLFTLSLYTCWHYVSTTSFGRYATITRHVHTTGKLVGTLYIVVTAVNRVEICFSCFLRHIVLKFICALQCSNSWHMEESVSWVLHCDRRSVNQSVLE